MKEAGILFDARRAARRARLDGDRNQVEAAQTAIGLYAGVAQ